MGKSLTIKEINHAKPKNKEYKLTIDRGLYIRVAPSGTKTWLVRYVINGKQKQVRLPKPFGPSGESYMSLVEAKAENSKIQALAKDNIDFQVLKEQEKELAIQIEKKNEIEKITFNDLYLLWLKDGVNRSDGNKTIQLTFKKHALPTIGDVKLKLLSENDLREVYKKIIDEGKCRTAVSLSKDIRQMLRWAEKRQPWRTLLATANPSDLIDIEQLLPNTYSEVRTRILTTDEIKQLKIIFDKTEQEYKSASKKYDVERPLKKESQIALWISLSTACRIGELLMSQWKHINFDEKTWFIPKENVKGQMKRKQSLLIFLSDFSILKLKELHSLTGDSEWLFPAQQSDTHVCIKSVSKQVGDRQTKFKNRTKPLANRTDSNSLVLGSEAWTPHDLRRTASTIMQKLKVPENVIDRCQNHVIPGIKVRKHYFHYDYSDEKKDAWQKLGQHISQIINS